MREQPFNYSTAEGQQQTRPAYLYFIQQVEGDVRLYATNFERPLILASPPAYIGGAESIEFTPTQIRHAKIEQSAEFNPQGVNLQAAVNNEVLKKYFVTAPTVKIRVAIIRANLTFTGDAPNDIDYAADALTIFRGVAVSHAFQEYTVQVALMPEPFQFDKAVPRFYFQRECNHVLYGPGCRVDAAAFTTAGTITEMHPWQRKIRVPELAAFPPAYHQGGLLIHSVSSYRIGIVASNGEVLTLAYWMPDFQIDDDVSALAGCDKTFDSCQGFDNVPNFGGFPFTPNSNPIIHGAT